MRAKYRLLRAATVVIDPMHKHNAEETHAVDGRNVCGCFSGGTLRNRKGVAEALPIA